MSIPGGPPRPVPGTPARPGTPAGTHEDRTETLRDDAVAEVVRMLPSVAALPLPERVEAYEHAAQVLAARLDDVEG